MYCRQAVFFCSDCIQLQRAFGAFPLPQDSIWSARLNVSWASGRHHLVEQDDDVHAAKLEGLPRTEGVRIKVGIAQVFEAFVRRKVQGAQTYSKDNKGSASVSAFLSAGSVKDLRIHHL